MSYKKKTSAKIARVKSVFKKDDKFIITSFGKGNEAVIDRIIDSDDNIENVAGIKSSFEQVSISDKSKNFLDVISKNNLSATPHRTEIRQDMLHAKDKLEEVYFGKTFNDNIHIQIAYNIADINKILALYANNIIYTLNNLRRSNDDEDFDAIGTLYTGNSWDKIKESFEKWEKLSAEERKAEEDNKTVLYKTIKAKKNFDNIFSQSKPYFQYMVNAFYAEDKEYKMRCDKDIYNIFRLMSMLRQSIFHTNVDENGKFKKIDIYNLSNCDKEIKSLLNSIYNKKISSVNDSFISNNGKNITILSRIYGVSGHNQKELIQEFYDFTVYKENKNFGFSTKKLRETIIEKYVPKLDNRKNDSINSVRGKIYTLFDFVLYKYYKDNPEYISAFVDALRNAKTEEDKQAIYEANAGTAYKGLKDEINNHLVEINGDRIQKTAKTPIPNDLVMITKENTKHFSKLIYLMTTLLDGKEINDLISTLINKFENINSFISVLDTDEVGFADDYKMFNESGDIAKQLRFIKNFARMRNEIHVPKKSKKDKNDEKKEQSAKKERPTPKAAQYKDVIDILGSDGIEDVNDYIKEKLLGNSDTSLRNFIINNVLESSRFKYIVRYARPAQVRDFAKNKVLVEFVLKRISKLNTNQIDRYYSSVTEENRENTSKLDLNKKIEVLTKKISEVTFKSFKNVQNKQENVEKERFKAIIGLYLTVIYQVTKNLVNVNSRYCIAESFLERDFCLFEFNLKKNDYCKLTRMFISKSEEIEESNKSRIEENNGSLKGTEQVWLKKKAREYLDKNISNAKDEILKLYRNTIVHLNAVTDAAKYAKDIKHIDSYFSLYHYIMQQYIKDKYNKKANSPADLKERFNDLPEILKGMEHIEKNNMYSRNVVKILNAPFGYNLARYKNLSIEGLFDMNEISASTTEENDK